MIIINKVVLLGRLTKDPELRYAPGTGTAVCRFIKEEEGEINE